MILDAQQWGLRQAAHRERADALSADYRAARDAGRRHAIDDFLFTYYSYKPAVLRKWHPGLGTQLRDADEFAQRRWYQRTEAGTVAVDAAAFLRDRAAIAQQVRELSEAILNRPARFDCFGLHEWAMVYREDEHRHPIPLRLGQARTDEVVEQHQIKCSHFDAFRFFTPPARPRNQLQPTRASQCGLEQAGCLHANMDLYKWAIKLGPLVPGELLLDAFELAREIRWLDMRASPYDVSDYGVPAVAIETAASKAEYVRYQRHFAARAQALRQRILDILVAAQAKASDAAA